MSIPKDSEKILASQALLDDFDAFRTNNFKSHASSELVQALDSLSARTGPPSNNMGGNLSVTPPFFPHSEKNTDSVIKQKTRIDWLAYTTAKSLDDIKLGLQALFPSVVFATRSGGLKGYPESMSIIVDDVQYGVIGHHGAVDDRRNYVSITGVGASTLSDDDVEVAYGMLLLLDARLSRLDICLDFFNGERTWDHASWAYDNTDGFQSRGGGKKPPVKRITGQDGNGDNTGRTMYVGRRGESEKFVRVYEKGLEVFANMPKELRDASQTRAMVFSVVDGEFADKWLRIEIEFSRQKKDLPLEMLLERDKYFAGAYPYCAQCLGLVDGLRPSALKTDLEVDLIKLISHGKKAYGSLIHTLKELGFTDGEVVQYMSSGKLNSKLVRSGVLREIKTRQAEILAREQERRSADPDWDIPDF